MNTQELARSTFVLRRETHEDLAFVAKRLGVSRSDFVRDVLYEPVSLMARWLRATPANPSPEDAQRLVAAMQADLGALIDSKAELLGGPPQ